MVIHFVVSGPEGRAQAHFLGKYAFDTIIVITIRSVLVRTIGGALPFGRTAAVTALVIGINNGTGMRGNN